MDELFLLRYVAVGGAIGALVRWQILDYVGDAQTATIIALNVVGSVLLGVLVGARRTRRHRAKITQNQFMLVGTGFCGGLTTFSTFALEVATNLDDGAILAALSTMFITGGVTVLGAGLGYRIGSRP